MRFYIAMFGTGFVSCIGLGGVLSLLVDSTLANVVIGAVACMFGWIPGAWLGDKWEQAHDRRMVRRTQESFAALSDAARKASVSIVAFGEAVTHLHIDRSQTADEAALEQWDMKLPLEAHMYWEREGAKL